jgi:hypothetical protein
VTKIICKKRELDENEFTFSPFASFTVNLVPLFRYIAENSNLRIEDVSAETDDALICFRVLKDEGRDG